MRFGPRTLACGPSGLPDDGTRATVHGRRFTFTSALPARLVARRSQRIPCSSAISHGTTAAAGARHLDRVAERQVLPLFARTPLASGPETGGGRLDSLARDGCVRVMIIHVSDLVVDMHEGALDFLEPLELMLRARIGRTQTHSEVLKRHSERSSVASSGARGHPWPSIAPLTCSMIPSS